MLKKLILIFLSWRIFLFIPLIASNYFLHPREGFGYTLTLHFLSDNSPISNFFLYPWGNFDGIYYLLIAAQGYTVNAGFFPLFPLSIKIASSIFGPSADGLPFDPRQYFTALILISTYFFLAIVVMYKLILIDFKKNIAFWSIIFMLVFPTSFFFASIYSESLFLLLTLLCFYFARKKKWLTASIFGALLTATRVVGIAIIPALLFEFLKTEKTFFKVKALSLILTTLGILSYMWFNFIKWGNALYFVQAQGNLQNNRTVNSIVLFPQTIYRYAKILTSVSVAQYEWWIALLEISVFIFAATLLFVAWKKKIRFSYILFSIIALLIPASTGTFSALPRYVLILFPIFIGLALVRNKTVKISYTIIGLILLFILFMLFSKGYFVG
ncbi:MAG: mannosyltransferase family protein [Candidatus Levybacteria bacterium]|nr:mannosyltransferase family protein [Candidatus Levybacteria bacterium]